MIEALKRSFAIAKKDMRIFYLKGPVVIMGLIFPFFLYGRWISLVSPLTYYADALRHSLGSGYLPVWLDLLMLALFGLAFFLTGTAIHRKVLERRFT